MTRRRKDGLFSAAGYLCCAVDDLRAAGFRRLADQVDSVIAALEGELASSCEPEPLPRITAPRGSGRLDERGPDASRRLDARRSLMRVLR